VATLYGEQLVRSGAVTREELDALWTAKKAEMQREGEAGSIASVARPAAVPPPPVDASALWGRPRPPLPAPGPPPEGLRPPPELRPGGLRAPPEARSLRRKTGGAAGGEGRGGLGHRRVSGLGQPPARGNTHPPLRAGLGPRHVQPAPRDPLRRADGTRVRSAE